MATWEQMFRNWEHVWKEPNTFVIKLVPILKKKKSKRILDLGCGAGRHLVYLGKRGFVVVGSDLSPSALKLSQERLEKEKVKNYTLIEHNMTRIPFPNNHFDAVISINVLHHDKLKNIKRTVDEVRRILKKNGLFLATVISPKSPKYKRGKEIEKDTFIVNKGHEAGIPHHFFDEKGIKKLFSKLKILKLEHVMERGFHWVILAEK